MSPRIVDIDVRFWLKVDIRHPRECWEWQAAITDEGYGYFCIRKPKVVNAHRWAYMHWHGCDLTSDQFVLHLCDNRPCCNPYHLVLGDGASNARDMKFKGRAGPRARKLTPDAVRSLVAMKASGASYSEIERAFDVSRSNAFKAVHGATYRDVERVH